LDPTFFSTWTWCYLAPLLGISLLGECLEWGNTASALAALAATLAEDPWQEWATHNCDSTLVIGIVPNANSPSRNGIVGVTAAFVTPIGIRRQTVAAVRQLY
jgi:hypothetical protein